MRNSDSQVNILRTELVKKQRSNEVPTNPQNDINHTLSFYCLYFYLYHFYVTENPVPFVYCVV